MTQHYFAFSMGSYSDYGVGGFFVCDHAVSYDDWKAHYEAFQTKLSEKRAESMGNNDWPAFRKWESENEPEASFQKLHNMTQIEYQELWRDV